ncbi:MAG: DNRLRE domain-containing protein [Bacteroidetes Order II. Incertae sedis bacterium]|nr:DNRLRE domain-containing protein [Bacteroidetes Order II. bacterium]MBT6423761.1 DNRLRE domain-containing protein [Bacteroidetes Order II. bacterium]MBT7400198.1 DNRLRE domain-containing protein [Bacteroidetes Order II. bacterium]
MGITTHWATKRLLKTFLACFLITSVSSILPVLAQVSPTADGRVILITVDGMRSDVIQSFGPELLPGFHRLMQEGSSTLNARPDPEFSLTLPNHTSMFTGRYVGDLEGHNWYENTDMPSNETLHNNKGEYVASLFDVVHDHGGRTGLFSTKSKFSLFDQSFNEQNGALDQTGADNGRDKIDTFYLSASTTDLLREFRTISSTNPFELAVFHIAEPDVAGHANGWSKDPSSAYGFAVRMADLLLQELMMEVDSNPLLSGQTHIIMTSDHGGDGRHHSNPKSPNTFTIPFMVWGPEALAGADLYALNATRTDPGNQHLSHQASRQTPPVRNADIANLSLSVLGLPSIPGSIINPDQDIVINTTTVVNPGQPIEIAFQSESLPKPNYSGAADTKLLSDAPNTTFGSAESLEMDGYPTYKGLLSWDISEIPTTATLVSAQITMDVTNVSGNEYGLFEMKRSWSEQEANWQMANNSTSWTSLGASASADRNTRLLGSLIPIALGSDTIVLNAEGLQTVQSWISNPELNFGFIIENASGGDDGLDIHSREANDASKRPKLSLVYSLEAPPTSNLAPISSFSHDPVNGSGPVRVAFDATASYDLDGLVVDYDWNFGDGKVGSGSRPEHTFTSGGQYLVRLIVTDDSGATAQSEKLIVVGSTDLETMSFQNGVFPDAGYAGAIDTKLISDSPRQPRGIFATDKSAAKPISRSNGLPGIQFEHGKIQ